MELVAISPEYMVHVEKSNNYLNCPKFILNEALFLMARLQGYQALVSFLTYFKFKKPQTTAKYVMDNYLNITPAEFQKINTNPYLDKPIEKLPLRCQHTDAAKNAQYKKEKERESRRWGW